MSTDQIDPELGSLNSRTYLITLATVGQLLVARLPLLAVAKKILYLSLTSVCLFLSALFLVQISKVSYLKSCF